MIGRSRWLLLSFVVFGAIAIGGIWTRWSAVMLVEAKDRSAENLHRIFAAMQQYANDDIADRYPDLAMGARGLAPEPEALYPRYLHDPIVFISPRCPRKTELLFEATEAPVNVINDQSYWYLGYSIQDERTGLSFVEDYLASAMRGRDVPEVSTWWDEEAGRRWEAQFERWKGEERTTRDERPVLGPPLVEPPLPPPKNERRRLRKGIERFFIFYFDQPAGTTDLPRSPFPIMIERPRSFGDGGHVLYLDGRVEWVSYPGPFPMTKQFIDAIESLDDIKLSVRAN